MTTVGDTAAPALHVAPAAERPRSSDLMAALAHLESAFAVASWRVDGLAVWPLLRLRWFFSEFARLYGAAIERRPGDFARVAGIVRAGRDAARSRREDSAGNDLRGGRRDLVFLSDGLSFAKLGDAWVERFCDPVIAAATKRGLTSALWTPLHTCHRPRATPSLWLQPAIDRANAFGALHAKLRPGEMALADHGRALAWLAAHGWSTAALERARIAADTRRLRFVARTFARRLAATAPRLAFVVSYYSLEGMAFVHACRGLDIPVVDLQHGVQGDLHPAYAAWPAPGAGGVHALVPDRFWVWSAWEERSIERWAAGTGHAAVVAGNPWLDVWREGSPWPGAAEAVAAARALRARSAGRPVVLVTLQFGLAPGEQIEPLRDLMRAAGDRLAFWVRLHPAMLERRDEVRARLTGVAPYELDACSDLPLHALLPVADVHLTHSSSTVIEAAQVGLASVLTTAYGAELFTPLIDAGVAHVRTGSAATVAETLARLARDPTRTPPAVRPLDDETLWRALLPARGMPHREAA